MKYGCKTSEDRSRIGMEVLTAVQVIDEYADEFILGFRATPEEATWKSNWITWMSFLKFFRKWKLIT